MDKQPIAGASRMVSENGKGNKPICVAGLRFKQSIEIFE